MSILRRIITGFSIISMILAFVSCSNDGVTLNQTDGNSTANVVTFSYKSDENSESAEIKSGLFAFILSTKKTDYLYYMSQYYDGASSQITVNDTEAFWNTVYNQEDGRTFKNIFDQDLRTYCKRLVITKALCKKYGISVTNNADTKKEIEDKVQNHINAYGDETSLNSYLYRFGITSDDLFEYYEMQLLIEALENYLYGDGGKNTIKADLIEEEFNKNFCKAKSIFISYTEPEIKLPDDSLNSSSSSSNYKFEFDGARTKDKVLSLANEIYTSIVNGEVSFDDKYVYSDDNMAEFFPDGKITARSSSDELINKALFDMEVGEIRVVEGNTGVYILSKEKFSKGDIDDYYDEIEQAFINENYAEFINNYANFVTVNEDELSKYDVITADILPW